MPFYQFDASAIVKRYVDEVGSDWVRAIVDPGSGNVISIADVTRAEVASARRGAPAKARSPRTKAAT